MNKGALDNNAKEEGGTKNQIIHQHQMKPNPAKYSKL